MSRVPDRVITAIPQVFIPRPIATATVENASSITLAQSFRNQTDLDVNLDPAAVAARGTQSIILSREHVRRIMREQLRRPDLLFRVWDEAVGR